MRSRFRFAAPARADGTVLPAVLVAVLGVTALAQLAWTDPIELPEAGPLGGGGPTLAVADPGSRGVPPALASRGMFSPTSVGGAQAQAAAADPLGGAAILGLVGVGRTRYLVVQRNGVTRRVAIGGGVAGWRVIGISDGAALLARGRERLTRPFGAAAAGSSGTEPSEESE